MKTNKKAFRIIMIGLLLNSSVLLFGQFINLTDSWMGFMQGLGIGIMIMGLYKMRKERTMG